MNLFAWIMLYAYGASLLGFSEMGGVLVEYEWKVSEDSSISIKENREVMILTFKDSESKNILKTYYLIPWTEIYEKTGSNDADISFMSDIALLCVTPNCVVYEKFMSSGLEASEQNKSELIEKKVKQMLDYDLYNREHDYKEGYTFKGLQIINMHEYENYIELNIALPGSDAVDYDALRAEFPKKMIRLVLQPDDGPVKIIWINSGTNALSEFLNKYELDITQTIKDGIVKESNHVTQQDYYLYTQEKVEDLVKKYKGSDDDHKYLKRLIAHLFHRILDGTETVYNENEMFPDYQPKVTPDITTDFRPSLTDEIQQIPYAKLENLPELVVKYSRYYNLAKENPGKWEDGNMILGANPREYNPSDAELMLFETGIRLQYIAENYDSKAIKTELKQAKLHLKKIEFNEFTFTHSDVMGSGRFFYVETINTVKMNLW